MKQIKTSKIFLLKEFLNLPFLVFSFAYLQNISIAKPFQIDVALNELKTSCGYQILMVEKEKNYCVTKLRLFLNLGKPRETV